jgi:hypothetical protein
LRGHIIVIGARYWLKFKFGGTEALASCGYRGGPGLRPANLRALIPLEHLRFIEGCRDYFEFEAVRQSSSTPTTNPTDPNSASAGASYGAGG